MLTPRRPEVNIGRSFTFEGSWSARVKVSRSGRLVNTDGFPVAPNADQSAFVRPVGADMALIQVLQRMGMRVAVTVFKPRGNDGEGGMYSIEQIRRAGGSTTVMANLEHIGTPESAARVVATAEVSSPSRP